MLGTVGNWWERTTNETLESSRFAAALKRRFVMSRTWKIILGVAVGLIVLALIAVPIVGHLVFGWERGAVRDRLAPWAQSALPGEAGLQVRLLDDDGDGVPDRGVVEGMTGSGFPGGPMGRIWGLRHSRPFTPFPILGGLVRVGLLVLLVVLIVRLFQRRRNRPSAPAQPQS
jgi:hypothetical protein